MLNHMADNKNPRKVTSYADSKSFLRFRLAVELELATSGCGYVITLGNLIERGCGLLPSFRTVIEALMQYVDNVLGQDQNLEYIAGLRIIYAQQRQQGDTDTMAQATSLNAPDRVLVALKRTGTKIVASEDDNASHTL